MKPADKALLKELVGKRISKFRTSKGISVPDFEALTGIGDGNLKKYEGGERLPTIATSIVMAHVLGITHLELLDVPFKWNPL